MKTRKVAWCKNHPEATRHRLAQVSKMTRLIVEVARPLGIAVHDHIVVGKDGHTGLKGLKFDLADFAVA